VKKHKNKIITGAVIVAVLAAAFLMGGGGKPKDPGTMSGADRSGESGEPANAPGAGGAGDSAISSGTGNGNAQNSAAGEFAGERDAPEDGDTPENPEAAGTETGVAGGTGQAPGKGSGAPAKWSGAPGAGATGGSAAGDAGGENTRDEIENASNPGSEAQNTGPVAQEQTPAATQTPDSQAPPQDGDTEGELTVTLIISAATILDNMDRLVEGKAGLIPQDGIIFSGTAVFYEGESVFNLLQREARKNRIHMESVSTPIYNSAYIEGINNIYEFDVGERSGWMYSVNGYFPNYGSSRCILQDGDVVKWLYTCDRGDDIGGGGAADHYGFG